MADRDTASGFGATAESDDNSDQINDLLDQVRDLLEEDGLDYATAEALTNFARRGSPSITGNLADLQRMGAIAATGKMKTAGQPDKETSDITDAFVEPPPPNRAPAGLQTPMGTTEPAEGDNGGLSGMTKDELLAEAESRGVAVNAGMTKAEIVDAINVG